MSEAESGFHHDSIHDGMGCKIRHGIGLQQVGPKPLIQAAVTGSRLRNDLYCVQWDVKLYYTIPYHTSYWEVCEAKCLFDH